MVSLDDTEARRCPALERERMEEGGGEAGRLSQPALTDKDR